LNEELPGSFTSNTPFPGDFAVHVRDWGRSVRRQAISLYSVLGCIVNSNQVEILSI